MRWVVFLRGINVGGANVCRPAVLANELSEFGMVNIGAVGTFVVRADVKESILRSRIAAHLADAFAIKCEIIICPARDITKLLASNPFARQPSGPDITRFVSILGKRPAETLKTPFQLPDQGEWLLKIIAIRGRFVIGLYRRQMKAISYLGKVEKLLGAPATTRNWNTIEKIEKLLAS